VTRACGIEAWVAGRVEAGPRQVVIEPLQLTFGGDDLHVRA
jgi:phosphoribosylformylglycinamidine cyclo-ligase